MIKELFSLKKLIIYGNGRIAKIVYQYVKRDRHVVAFTVDKELIDEQEIEGLPIIGFDSIEKIYPPSEYEMLICVGYLQMNHIRFKKYTESKAKGYDFANFIHSSVELHDNIIMGSNNIILDHVTLQPYVKLGHSNFIWSNSVIAHGTTIGNANWVTSGVVISGDATIKSNCFLGINASIGHNITLENETFVGANTLLTKNSDVGEVFITRDGEKFRLDSQRFLKFSAV